ncbi:MAG TPA: hypothetical protein VGR45_14220 [Stellaceae bacterium]|nr:hypothetical protein [Stellaceae bacterium]
MELDKDALNAACFSLAQSNKWERRPIDVASIEILAKRLVDISSDHISYLEGQGRDPNIIVRAIRYIEHHNDIGPHGDRTDWFFYVLQALIELACPNTASTIECEAFYHDIEDGISEARADYENQ